MKNLTRYGIIALALLAATPALATQRVSVANGSIGTAATWNTVDSASYSNSETANTALTTTPVASSTFTPAAATLTQIGTKIASRAATPSGTFTIKLANSTAPGSRECTATINVSDVPAAGTSTTGGPEGGWVFVACTAAPNGTDAYTLTLSTSASTQINIFSTATTNWDRILVTNATGAAAAGDQLFVAGLTASGALTTRTVTVDTTVLVNYGNIANTGTPECSICVSNGGVLQSGSAASTAYVFEHAGTNVVYRGGSYTVGTAGTPVPSTSSMTYTMNATAEGDTGVICRDGSTCATAGVSGGRLVGKANSTTTLTQGVTTNFTTDVATGWLSGDAVAIAGTVTTSNTDASSLWDTGTLSGNASGTGVTLSAAPSRGTHTATALSYTSTSTGIAYAMNMYPAVINLTRNVTVKGSGATTNGYWYCSPNASCTFDWTRFTNISGTAAGKRGIEVDTGPGGALSLTNLSVDNGDNGCVTLGPTNTNFGGTQSNYATVQHVVMYNCEAGTTSGTYALGLVTATYNPYWKIDDFTLIRGGYGNFASRAVFLASQNGQFTNVTISGSGASAQGALMMSQNYDMRSMIGGQVGNTFGPIYEYANVGYPFTAAFNNIYGVTGTINGWYIWHEQGRFTPAFANGEMVIDPFYIVQSAFGIYAPASMGWKLTVRNGVIGFDAAASGNVPLTIDAGTANVTFDNMELCPPAGALGGVTWVACGKTLALMNDLTTGGSWNPTETQVTLRNTSILNNQGTAYPTLVGQEGFFGTNAWVAQDCAACKTPAIPHDAWLPGGFVNYDTAITHMSGYSLRMTPRILTATGYISSGSGQATAGTTLTLTSGVPSSNFGDALTSDCTGFVNGTLVASGFNTSYTVTQSQYAHANPDTSPPTPCHFQTYNNRAGLLRLQSAPLGQGIKIAVKSGVAANVCVWLRPSINTDAAPPWGGSAVTYNGDAPRLINRQNPGMGVQSDTVLATASLSAGTWTQQCANLPSAPNDGAYELAVDADQTFTSNPGGSINVAEWSCTNCNAVNTGQFWWNGVPAALVTPASTGGGAGGGGFGGFGRLGG